MPSAPTPTSFFTLRVPDDLLEDMRRRAEREDRSVSALIRQAVRGYVGKSTDR
jgi:predicted transcriptional regulator